MKNFWLRRGRDILSVCLAVSLVVSTIGIYVGTDKSQAATFSEINQDSVFLKQAAGSNTCTLVAATMLVRRAAMMNGNSRWDAITEDVMRSAAWVEGSGLKWDFNVSGITVTHAGFSGSAQDLQSKLAEHPEGVVLYKQKSDQQHAILVTDYTDGVFYCADPSSGKASGRIPISSASITVEACNYMWYVTSPTLYLMDDSGSTISHVVETAQPTATTKATATPKATAKVTATPKATAKSTTAPKTTTKPKGTSAPKTTVKPKATAVPKTTTKTTSASKTAKSSKTTSKTTAKATAPAKVKGIKIKNSKKKTLTITWEKTSGAQGYQVRFGKSKNLSGSAKVTLEGHRASLTNLTKGSVFYVKVRAYKLNGNKKVYGSYSRVIKGKVKK